MFFCALSGEPPQEPVVSVKSGKVYERRLILKYITENGTDPITGDKLEESDLVVIKACMSSIYHRSLPSSFFVVPGSNSLLFSTGDSGSAPTKSDLHSCPAQ
jgi:hypothetical protein